MLIVNNFLGTPQLYSYFDQALKINLSLKNTCRPVLFRFGLTNYLHREIVLKSLGTPVIMWDLIMLLYWTAYNIVQPNRWNYNQPITLLRDSCTGGRPNYPKCGLNRSKQEGFYCIRKIVYSLSLFIGIVNRLW